MRKKGTKKYIRNKLKSRRRRNKRSTRSRKQKQRGGCINGQCMTGGGISNFDIPIDETETQSSSEPPPKPSGM